MIWQLLERPDIKHLLKELITNRSAYPHVDRLASVHYINTVSINALRRQMKLRRQADFSLRRVNYHFLNIKNQSKTIPYKIKSSVWLPTLSSRL